MYTLRLYQDRFSPNTRCVPDMEAQHSFLYACEGSVTVNGQLVPRDTAMYNPDVVSVEAGPDGAWVWRWELVRTSEPNNLAQGQGIKSRLRMSRRIRMLELVPTSKWIFRLDAILRNEGRTGLHSHPGSGIRCLVEGHMRIESEKGECSDNRQPGDAWYEEGSYPIVASADEGETRTFLRGMVLPSEYSKYPANPVFIEGAPTKRGDRKVYLQHLISLR